MQSQDMTMECIGVARPAEVDLHIAVVEVWKAVGSHVADLR